MKALYVVLLYPFLAILARKHLLQGVEIVGEPLILKRNTSPFVYVYYKAWNH